jgi:hypothetical protein
MKSGLVLEVVNECKHKDWVTVTALDASGQSHYLDSRRDKFEPLPEKGRIEYTIILLENRIREVNSALDCLDKEREELRKQISQHREKLTRFSMNPIEDFKYD